MVVSFDDRRAAKTRSASAAAESLNARKGVLRHHVINAEALRVACLYRLADGTEITQLSVLHFCLFAQAICIDNRMRRT